MLFTDVLLDATLVRLEDAHTAATSVPVVLLAGVLLGALLVSLVAVRDVVLLTIVRLDAKMVVLGEPLAGVLLDALLAQLGDVRDAVTFEAVLSDVAMLAPDAVLTVVLPDALLVTPTGVRDVARLRQLANLPAAGGTGGLERAVVSAARPRSSSCL